MSSSVLIASNLITPLGVGIQANWDMLSHGVSGIGKVNRPEITLKDFYGAAIDRSAFDFSNKHSTTWLETLCIEAITEISDKVPVRLSSARSVFIFSTTKGNVDELTSGTAPRRLMLGDMAGFISAHFQNPNSPFVVSNACISGLSAIILADILLKNNQFDQVVVCGADILSEFTVSGFNALQAISSTPCRPFDAERSGLSPGEAVAVVAMTRNDFSVEHKDSVRISGCATSNDANHISGPSRDGSGLALAIRKSMDAAGIKAHSVDYVSTHGTATIFNDESESLALQSAGVNQVAANSLKGYFGHTFGAAGVVEVVLAAETMKRGVILQSAGFQNHGVSAPINIATSNIHKQVSTTLKTASGFGGCNAALILTR